MKPHLLRFDGEWWACGIEARFARVLLYTRGVSAYYGETPLWAVINMHFDINQRLIVRETPSWLVRNLNAANA